MVAIALPIGEEAGFKGIVDLIALKAYNYSGTAGKGTEGPIPDDLMDAVNEAREALVDRVAESDDTLLEKYLEGEELSQDEITAALEVALAAGIVSPVIPVCATKILAPTGCSTCSEWFLPPRQERAYGLRGHQWDRRDQGGSS